MVNVSIENQADSPKYTLNKKDLIKIGKGALIAVGASLVAYGLEVLPLIEVPQNLYIVIPIVGILLNSARKFFAGQTETK